MFGVQDAPRDQREAAAGAGNVIAFLTFLEDIQAFFWWENWQRGRMVVPGVQGGSFS